MINIEATIRWKGYNPEDLSPMSGRRVWANCDECGNGKWVPLCNYKRKNVHVLEYCIRCMVNIIQKNHVKKLKKD